jgi:hypothetical protein
MRQFVLLAVAGTLVLGGSASATARERAVSCPDTSRTLAMRQSPSTYDDTVEDAGAAPDFCAANLITNDNEGAITIALHMHNRAGYEVGDVYELRLDTDLNASTGGNGAEYVIELRDGNASLLKWSGTAFETVAAPSLETEWIPGLGPAVFLNRTDLGNASAFNFVLASHAGSDGDVAPNTGAWRYTLAPLTLEVESFLAGPAKAGSVLAARMVVLRSDFDVELEEGQVSCNAAVVGRSLRGVGKFVGDEALCTWKLPKNARGKRLTGRMAVQFQGANASRSFALRVR